METAGDRVSQVSVICGRGWTTAGVPWMPRLGGRAPLGAELDRAARTGRWDRSRHAGRSEVAHGRPGRRRGPRLAAGRRAAQRSPPAAWKGFPGLYYRASEPGRMDRLLPLEWRKCVAFVAGRKTSAYWLTSDSKPRPPAPIDGADEFGLIRQWVTGTGCAAADPERVRRWGRRAVAIRQLLAAIGQAAMVSGSSVLEFGTPEPGLALGPEPADGVPAPGLALRRA